MQTDKMLAYPVTHIHVQLALVDCGLQTTDCMQALTKGVTKIINIRPSYKINHHYFRVCHQSTVSDVFCGLQANIAHQTIFDNKKSPPFYLLYLHLDFKNI